MPAKNIEALKEAIQKIYEMDFEAMGKFAKEYAQNQFSWEKNAEKIRELYSTLSSY